MKKKKSRHLTQEQRKNYVNVKKGVQVFSGNITPSIPFNTIKKIDDTIIRNDYVEKASDISVIPFNNVKTLNVVPEKRPSETGIIIETLPSPIQIPSPVKSKDIVEFIPNQKLKEEEKFFEIKDISNSGLDTSNEAVKKFYQIKNVVER